MWPTKPVASILLIIHEACYCKLWRWVMILAVWLQAQLTDWGCSLRSIERICIRHSDFRKENSL